MEHDISAFLDDFQVAPGPQRAVDPNQRKSLPVTSDCCEHHGLCRRLGSVTITNAIVAVFHDDDDGRRVAAVAVDIDMNIDMSSEKMITLPAGLVFKKIDELLVSFVCQYLHDLSGSYPIPKSVLSTSYTVPWDAPFFLTNVLVDVFGSFMVYLFIFFMNFGGRDGGFATVNLLAVTPSQQSKGRFALHCKRGEPGHVQGVGNVNRPQALQNDSFKEFPYGPSVFCTLSRETSSSVELNQNFQLVRNKQS